MWGIVYLPDWDIPLQQGLYHSESFEDVSAMAAALNSHCAQKYWLVVPTVERGGRWYITDEEPS